MRINRNKIFFGIFAFLIVVNILVFFNLNYFYIRAILAFVFLITVPGLLIMLIFRIRKINFWEYLVYTIGLSVSFIMFGGLLVNWTLPLMKITDKPLSLIPVLISFNLFLLIFWVLAFYRNRDLNFEIKFPEFDWTNRIFIIVPMIFLPFSILGALILNNFGPNYLTMIMLGGIAIYVFMVVIYREKINENVFPWALLMIGLSLLLASSFRSWYVSGVDTNLEFSIFNLTLNKSIWDIKNFKHAYNAMLSVNILPTIIKLFSGFEYNNQLIFKLNIALIFSFISIPIFLFSNKILEKNLSFLASLFFIFQPMFMSWHSIPIRQQIAFLFFGLMLAVWFSSINNVSIKKILFIIFGFSMIVSHYSTSYIALCILFFMFIFTFFYEKSMIKKRRKIKNKSVYLDSGLILVLLVFGFVWYSQLTDVSAGLVNFVSRSIKNIDNILKEDVQAEGQTPLEHLNPFVKKQSPFYLLESLKNEAKLFNNSSEVNKFVENKYPTRIIFPKGLPIKYGESLKNFLDRTKQFFEWTGRMLIILGVISLFFIFKREDNYKENYFLIFSCSFVLGIIIIAPFSSVSYDLARTYQQVLIILSTTLILGFKFLFGKKRKFVFVSSALFLIIYFLIQSGFFYQVIGGYEIPIRLNNNGLEYNRYFIHNSGIISALWFMKNRDISYNLFINKYENLGMILVTNPKDYINRNFYVFPQTIDKKSYVYSGYSGKIEGVSIHSIKGTVISYNFPNQFLNENKNKIYNNGGSEIFK